MDQTSTALTSLDTQPSNGAAAKPAHHSQSALVTELEGLIKRLRAYHPDFDDTIVRTAFIIAHAAHEKQQRSSGEPYILHPVAVSHILIDLKLDPACIAAGLLHDVVEDTTVSLDQIKETCGPEIAKIVDGL